jgi:hypothetical protein
MLSVREQLGIDSNDLGTHSLRKGATTFAQAGSPDGCNYAVMSNRGGWGSKDAHMSIYVQTAPGGDQFAGRTLAGAPVNTIQFALLPPHFGPASRVVCDAMRACFPTLSKIPAVVPILYNCLASLVYHSEWIKETFDRRHPIFHTVLFRQQRLLPQLRPLVFSGLESPHMRATGIPGIVHVIRELSKQTSILADIFTNLQGLPGSMQGEFLGSLSSLLEDRGVQAGNITKEYLDNCLTEIHNAIRELSRRPANLDSSNVDSDANAMTVEEPSTDSARVYSWPGDVIAARRVPHDFSLPDNVAGILWQLWWEGTLEIPAYRTLAVNDVPQTIRKRFSALTVWSSFLLSAYGSLFLIY